MSTEITTALRAVHGKEFTFGSISQVIYPASGSLLTIFVANSQFLTILGSSADWAYDTADIPCSYAVELRDEGRYGFLLPESEIKPVEEERFAAFKKMADHVIDGRCETK